MRTRILRAKIIYFFIHMPELPEVETIRQDLRQKLLGKPIMRVNISHQKSVRNPAGFFVKTLAGESFAEIDRIGKLLIFKLKRSGLYFLVHLKMTGQLIYVDGRTIVAGGHSQSRSIDLPNKHTRAILEFKGGAKLFFNDLRKFGYLEIIDGAELAQRRRGYGLEPNTKDYSLAGLKEIFQRRRAPIKAVLLNQKLIAGIGNIYADEILFAAGVKPTRPADSLTDGEIKKIFLESQKILKLAIKYRGTTFNNYVDSAGRKGNFTAHLQVYGRTGQACRRCRGIIKKMKVAGRGTHYCECQR